MSWFLYVIECEDGTLYTGIARDPKVRFRAHVAGKGAAYTRSHPPRRLLVIVAYPDQSSALKAEYQVKRMTAQEKRNFALAPESVDFSRDKLPD